MFGIFNVNILRVIHVAILFILVAFSECSSAQEEDRKAGELQRSFTKSVARFDGSKTTLEDYKLFEVQMQQIVNQDANHIEALFYLGFIQLYLGSYENAKTSFEKVVSLGGTYAKHYIRRMQFQKKVVATKEEFFLAICYNHMYVLPIPEKDFEFSCQMTQVRNLRTDEFRVSRALCAHSLENDGLICAPIIWIMSPTGFHNNGKIETQLLIVGEKEVKLPKKKKKESRVR